ncbi:MAG: response regulator [Ruminococcus sp.]|nr:response regulator [Ruminococcus sp.]
MLTLSIDDQKAATDLMTYMLNKIDPDGTHLAANSASEALTMLSDDVQIVFLDIEMPGSNGIQLADKIRREYDSINVIFVTGHPEYSFEAYGVRPSGFLAKPVTEKDIERELKELRYPISERQPILRVQCSPFAVFANDEPFEFKRQSTMELFAYLVYKKGAYCSNNEIIAVLWGGGTEKQAYLRKLLSDMRECFNSIGLEDIIAKKYGKTCVNMKLLQCVGSPQMIVEEYGWIE